MSEVSKFAEVTSQMRDLILHTAGNQKIPVVHILTKLGDGCSIEYTGFAQPENHGDTLFKTGGQNGSEVQEWVISNGPQGMFLSLPFNADTRVNLHQKSTRKFIYSSGNHNIPKSGYQSRPCCNFHVPNSEPCAGLIIPPRPKYVRSSDQCPHLCRTFLCRNRRPACLLQMG